MPKNLRHYFRVPVNFDARISRDDNAGADVEIANISRSGLMVRCDRAALEQITPNQISVAPRQPIEVTAAFTLEGGNNRSLEFETPAQIIYTRRLSREEFNLGLEFLSLTDEQVNFLSGYIEKHKSQWPEQ